MKAPYVTIPKDTGQPVMHLRAFCPECGKSVSVKMMKGVAVYNSHWSRRDKSAVCEGSGQIQK